MKLQAKLAGVLFAAATVFAGTASAEDWRPSGPLMFQIGFGAGGSTDAMGRVIAKTMEEQTGWNVVVENKPGAGGVAMFTGIAKGKGKLPQPSASKAFGRIAQTDLGMVTRQCFFDPQSGMPHWNAKMHHCARCCHVDPSPANDHATPGTPHGHIYR